MGVSDEQIDLEGPVLAELEAVEAVQDEPLRGGQSGTQLLVEQQTVASETIRLANQGGVGDAELEGNLAERRAADSAQQNQGLEVGTLEKVGGGEGL